MHSDYNDRLRERLRNTDYAKSARFEQRLARKGDGAQELHNMLAPNGKNPIVTTFVIVINLLGIIAAMIPTLLYFAITTVPAYLGFLFFSGF